MSEDTQPQSKGRSASTIAGAGGSMLAARLVSQVAQLALFIVAARVLSPADFGVFTLAVAGAGLLALISAAGWREFILGWGGDNRAIHQAISYSLLAGAALGAVGVAIAAAVSALTDNSLLALLALILSGFVFLGAPAQAWSAVLVRKDAVFSLAAATIAGELAGLAIGVYGLLSGWGVLALGAAKLTTQAIILLAAVAFARWPLRISFRNGYAREILSTTREILASRIISFSSANASTFIVGFFLGVAAVGYFRAAERVVSAISELVYEPLRLVAWMVFRKAADGAEEGDAVVAALSDEARRFLPLALLVAGPTFIGLAVVAEPLIILCLGETWAPSAAIASILAIAVLLLAPSVATEPLLTITGKIKALPPISLLNAAVSVTLLLVLTPFGAVATAVSRLIAWIFAAGTSIYLQTTHARAPWGPVLKSAAPVGIALAVMIAGVYGARSLAPVEAMPVALRLLAEVGVGAVAYGASLMLIRPSYVRQALSL